MTKDQIKNTLLLALTPVIATGADPRVYMEALLEVAAKSGADCAQSRDVFLVMADYAWSEGVADGSSPMFVAEAKG